ncbi:MAG TPA: hypothetical protein PLP03_03170 [Bacteroidales bacterium]|jgi:hypothetical protein|nr:hypothetical protein [Bacteroidales bacterium]HPY67145.1 hypothetical protein [Bacteroidales bacterium]
MTFDNSKTIINFRIKLFFATILAIAWIALAYLIKLIKFPLLGIDDGIWTLIIVLIWLVIALIPMILNYQYVFYSDEGENIVFRYFNAGIVGGKKNSIEIYKPTFAGYSTVNKYFGLSSNITLYQKTGPDTAKFPPVYISALTKDQKEKLFRSLSSYSPKK